MSIYRSARAELIARRRAHLDHLHALAAPALPRVRAAVCARVGRVAAGLVGVVGTAGVAALAYMDAGARTTHAFLGTLAAALGAYVLAWSAATLTIAKRARRPLTGFTGEDDVDLARLEAWHPLTGPAQALTRLRRASVVLPLVALSLLGPLAVHFPVAATLKVSASEFGAWVRLSWLLVGLAHLVLARLSLGYARRLLLEMDGEAPVDPLYEWLRALALTVLASCIPGLVETILAPVLTGVTGFVLVPAMFAWIRARLRGEALALEAARAACDPRAVTSR
jgi:hypothetical protein